MSGLSRTADASGSAKQECKDPCCQRFEAREQLIAQGRERARHMEETGGGNSARLSAAADRLEQYNGAIIRARAAEAVYSDGDAHCLDALTPEESNTALGLPPGTLTEADFRDDETGFRAGLYRSRSDDSLILAYRGTQPDMIVDWETNIDNGLGRDTAQYQAARKLAGKIDAAGVPFEIAGHSKGGGLAAMAAAVTPGVNATTFNAAGVSPDLLSTVGGGADAADRIQAFSFSDEFLTSMQSVTDPAEKVRRAQQLRTEIAGDAGTLNPLSVEHVNPAELTAREALRWRDFKEKRALSAAFDARRTELLEGFDREIQGAREAAAGGDDLSGYFPPALGTPVDMGEAGDVSYLFNDRLNALNNHTMSRVVGRMEQFKTEDRTTLEGGG